MRPLLPPSLHSTQSRAGTSFLVAPVSTLRTCAPSFGRSAQMVGPQPKDLPPAHPSPHSIPSHLRPTGMLAQSRNPGIPEHCVPQAEGPLCFPPPILLCTFPLVAPVTTIAVDPCRRAAQFGGVPPLMIGVARAPKTCPRLIPRPTPLGSIRLGLMIPPYSMHVSSVPQPARSPKLCPRPRPRPISHLCIHPSCVFYRTLGPFSQRICM